MVTGKQNATVLISKQPWRVRKMSSSIILNGIPYFPHPTEIKSFEKNCLVHANMILVAADNALIIYKWKEGGLQHFTWRTRSRGREGSIGILALSCSAKFLPRKASSRYSNIGTVSASINGFPLKNLKQRSENSLLIIIKHYLSSYPYKAVVG